MTAALIWGAISVPVALAVGRMLAGSPGGTPSGPPLVPGPAESHLVRS